MLATMEITKDTTGTAYKVSNGTWYHIDTPDHVIDCLETARSRGQRIRLFCGDNDTGRDWMEEYGTIGTVGRSTGPVKIPLLVHSSRSYGGAAILTHCIVRITVDRTEVHRHPNYYQPEMRIVPIEPGITTQGHSWGIWMSSYPNHDHVAAFPTRLSAQRWIHFMQGKSNRK